MKKTILALLLVLALCLPCFAACDTGKGDQTEKPTASESETVIESETTSVSENETERESETETITASEGLVFTSNGDGTCYVSGKGTCEDNDVLIPSVSPEGDTVTSIGARAFSDCISLTSVVIPDSVTSIGWSAFGNCYKLIEVYNLSNLEITAESLSNGNVASYAKNVYTDTSGESKLCEKDGYIFYCDNATGEYYLMGYSGDGTELVLPDDINGNNYEIYQYAFYSYTSLTGVEIPDSVENIGSYAFEDCDSLTSVVIGDSVTSIGERVFYGCDNLTSVVIGDSVESIGERAFYGCDNLTSVVIPDSVESIGDEAFDDCDSLTSVVIGDSVESIGSSAFYNCYKLIEVYNLSDLEITAGSKSNGEVAYYAKNVYTDTSGESKLCEKDGYIFYCDNATGEYYLMGYSGDETELVLPDDINGHNYEIYQYAFHSCTSLTSVVIGDSVTSIGNDAFRYCNSLTSVVIGDSVTSIGEFAFSRCDSLTSVVIPDSVTSIGNCAFSNCTSLTSVVIGNRVTSIGYNAFSDCTSLTSVVIPDSVTSIGEFAFSACYGLTSVVVGDSVTSIGSSAFKYCYKLIEVYNLSDLEMTVGSDSNGEVAYYAKNVYTDMSVESKLCEKDGYIFYCDNATGEYYLMGYTGDETELVLPDDINGHDYEIYKYAFYYCDSLTSVVIPDSVTSIGDHAFYACYSLTSVAIPDSVESIGNGAFQRCSLLASVVIPDSVTSIGYSAFRDCDNLTSIKYCGTEEQWDGIDKGSNWNDTIGNHTITYNYIPEGE